MSTEHPIETVVVVDDDEIEQYAISRLIRRHGMVENLLWFSDPNLALAFLERRDRPQIDLLCVDISMPQMNGFDFLDAAAGSFAAELERAVLIMLSVSTHESDRQRASECALVDYFFTKPLTPDQLGMLTQEVMSRIAGAPAVSA